MRNLTPFLLLLTQLGFSQGTNFISDLKNKSFHYFESTSRVKLELFFNQSKYLPGDTAYLRGLYLNAVDLKPVKGTQVVHLCLFDQWGVKKMVRWFLIIDGVASNKFSIPNDLAPGNYAMVAFTDWMKNMDQSLFFKQQFLISGKKLFERVPTVDSLAIFTEGGSLVSGVENRLALRYLGSEPQAKIFVKESGDIIQTLVASNDSITMVKLTPQTNKDYSFELTTPKSSKKFNCSPISPSGISIALSIDNASAKVNLECSLPQETKSDPFYLFVFSPKGLAYSTSLDFSAESRKEIVLTKNLSEGISQIIVVDSKNKLWSTRVVYASHHDNEFFSIGNILGSYATRDRVKAEIQIANKDGQSLNGIIAYNVVKTDLISTLSRIDYFNFTSDVSNSLEFPNRSLSLREVNNFLIGQTCPWFDWNKLIGKDQAKTFIPQSYLNFSGLATYAKNGLPVKDSTLLMFFLESNLKGYETYADSKGRFSFPLVIKVFENDKFFYAPTYKGRDVEGIILKIDDPDSLIRFKAEPFIESDAPDPYSLDNDRMRVINNSYSYFLKSKSQSDSLYNPNQSIEELLKGTDITLNVSDYLMMPTMEDVVKELLKGVEYRKIKGRDVVRVITTYRKQSADGVFIENYFGPLYFIDGQITKDPKIFMALKPVDVISIKVVKNSQRLLAIGSLGANGVIMVRTKRFNAINEKNKIEYSGLLPASPSTPRVNSNKILPDFRSCLFWSPYFKLTQTQSTQIQFNTSDDVGKFTLQVYGLTDDGKFVYEERPFEVKYSGN